MQMGVRHGIDSCREGQIFKIMTRFRMASQEFT
jgi:hypothetical protein